MGRSTGSPEFPVVAFLLFLSAGAIHSLAQTAPAAPAQTTPSAPVAAPLAAQAATATRPAPTPEQLDIQAASEKDHQRMMDLLGIKELRPGASG